MKAGTAQKLVLNTFSTAVMVRLGRVYSNLMIDMVATNAKLRGRMISILVEATGCAEEVCRRALHEADGDLKTALVSLRLRRRGRRRPGRAGPLRPPGPRRARPARLLTRRSVPDDPPGPLPTHRGVHRRGAATAVPGRGDFAARGLFIGAWGNPRAVDEPTGPPARIWQ